MTEMSYNFPMGFLIPLLLLVAISFGETLYIAVAASMRPLFVELAEVFESEHRNVEVRLTFGSSGNLYRQIAGGAPYDLFASADVLYAEKLRGTGKAVYYREFARGRLVVFSARSKDYRDGVEVLRNSERIALASPRHAPYGRSAVAFLKRAGLYEEVRHRLLYGANTAQALQFAASGGADAAVVPLSLVLHYGKGRFWEVPRNLYPPIRHTLVLTSRGEGKRSAREFLRFMKGEKARQLVEKHGFGAM